MATRVKSRHVVKPAEPTWQGNFPLTVLDQIGVITHASILYFYDRPTQGWLDPSNNKIVTTLKDSLSRILVPFYPFAGRLSWIAGGRLKLECNSMGAELTEAESSKKISDYGDFCYSSLLFGDLLPHMDYSRKPIQEIPLVAVQITRFACGGISLGIELSHVLADGRTLFHFMKGWARLARGEPLLEVAPYLDRRVLQADQPVDDQVCDADFHNPITQRGSGDSQNLEQKAKQVFPTFAVLTSDQIERLKDVANSPTYELAGSRPYSRFEVITAHVWRCMTKARDLKSKQATSLYVIVDTRSRMKPPLPSSYFGNATVPVESSTSAGELISKPLSYACSKVREAIEKVTNEYVIETIEALKKERNLSNYQYIEDRGNTEPISDGAVEYNNPMMITSWLNLTAQGIDFGWGKEIYNGPPTGRAGDGYSFIFPHKNRDGSIVVAAWLHHKEKFLKYMGFSIASKI